MADNNDKFVAAVGLWVSPNDLNAPNGALIVAEETSIIKEGVIEKRRGFKKCADNLPATIPSQIFNHKGYFFAHMGDKLYFEDPLSGSACFYEAVQSTVVLLRPLVGFFFDEFWAFFSSALSDNIIYRYIIQFDNVRPAGLLEPLFTMAGIPAGAYPRHIWYNSATSLVYWCQQDQVIRSGNVATGVITVIAGTSGAAGSADGIGAAARFDDPYGIIGDGTYLYITDNNNQTIRRLEIATNTVTTIAGTAGAAGSADGVGAAARFNSPQGIILDNGFLYICDNGNDTIRKLEVATNTVTTFAGTAGMAGTTDGIGAAARFNDVNGITSDGTYLYVTDGGGSCLIRRITIANQTVLSVAGTAGVSGWNDGVGVGTNNIDQQCDQIAYNSALGYVMFADSPKIRRLNLINYALETVVGTDSTSTWTLNLSNISVFNGPDD